MRLYSIWCFVPLFGMFLVSFLVPIFLDRYLVYAAPGFALLVAACINGLHLPTKALSWLTVLAIGGIAFTFTPWKESVLHPSRVVAQVARWRNGPVLIQPGWYELTYLWAGGPNDCFQVAPEEQDWCMAKGFNWGVYDGNDLPIAPAAEDTVVLVDAGSSAIDPSGEVKRQLRLALPLVDSVEADHGVWVYRFSR